MYDTFTFTTERFQYAAVESTEWVTMTSIPNPEQHSADARVLKAVLEAEASIRAASVTTVGGRCPAAPAEPFGANHDPQVVANAFPRWQIVGDDAPTRLDPLYVRVCRWCGRVWE